MNEIWTKEQEAKNLDRLFQGVSNKAAFARDFKVPGGASMLSQHCSGHRPMSFEAAIAYARGFACDLSEISPRLAEVAAQATNDWAEPSNAEDAGRMRLPKRTPVVGTAQMGEDGFYEELEHPTGFGDGWVDSYNPDPNAYALRVKGDSMHPAIRHGSFVVVEPNGQCVPGEYVMLALLDGRKMVKELVRENDAEIVIESVNGNHRRTLERHLIEKMHPIGSIVPASKWRSG